MSVDAKWFALHEQQQYYAELARAREDLAFAAMLTGEECTLFGRRVRLRLEWIDESPMTDDQLRQYGEQMKTNALRRLG